MEVYMQKKHIPSGSDVSAGTFKCNNCGARIKVLSVKSLPPCAKCHKADWKTVSGVGDAKVDPYPKK